MEDGRQFTVVQLMFYSALFIVVIMIQYEIKFVYSLLKHTNDKGM